MLYEKNIDTLAMIPPVLANTDIFKSISYAESQLLNDFILAQKEVCDCFFAKTSTDKSLLKYLKALGLPTSQNTEAKRASLIGNFCAVPPVNLALIKSLCSIYLGNSTSIAVDYPQKTLSILYREGALESNFVKKHIRQLIPLNVKLEMRYNYPTFEEIDQAQLTFSTFDAISLNFSEFEKGLWLEI